MNLVAFSVKTKGARNFARRIWTVFARFGFTEARIRRALYAIIETMRAAQGAPTFFIPAVVLERHPALIAEIVQGGTEIGIHGYVHNDYRTLSKQQQFQQTQRAIGVFKRLTIPYYGFRNPYLGWNRESLQVYNELGIHYESNIAILHDVLDLKTFTPLLRSGFEKSLRLFQALPCSTYALRPRFEGELLRIPTSIPDDEILFDRLRITDPLEVGRIWGAVMQRVYDRGGLYALNFHPERGVLCQRALETLLAAAQKQPLPVWITRIGDIAQWWKTRSDFRMDITALGEQRWQVEAHCSPRALILARCLSVEVASTQLWYGIDDRVQAQSFVVNAATCPCIAVSEETREDVVQFLSEQGYPVMRCGEDEAQLYTMYIDKPAGFAASPEERSEEQAILVEQIEALEKPLLHFGCWPDGCRAALAISGDIDSVTIQDFFLRIVEVFRQSS